MPRKNATLPLPRLNFDWRQELIYHVTEAWQNDRLIGRIYVSTSRNSLQPYSVLFVPQNRFSSTYQEHMRQFENLVRETPLSRQDNEPLLHFAQRVAEKAYTDLGDLPRWVL